MKVAWLFPGQGSQVVGMAKDVLDASPAARDVFKRVDAIMHFAAHCYVGESVTNPRKYFRNNIQSALTLLNAALDAGVISTHHQNGSGLAFAE